MRVLHNFFVQPIDPEQPIFVIGDIHGDLGLLLCLLHDCAQVIQDDFTWVPGNRAWIIFLGDMVDRYRPGDTPTHADCNQDNACVAQKDDDKGKVSTTHCTRGSNITLTHGGDGCAERTPGEIQDEELLIQMYLNKLQEQAQRNGGQIIKIIGNHEIMNMQGQYNYATPMGRNLREHFPIQRGTKFARAIMSYNAYMILQIGCWMFVHGGL